MGVWSPALADITPQEWVNQVLDTTDAPGVTMGVANGDGVEIAAGGLRLFGNPSLVSPDDLWHVGSITKSMTATLVARLVETGAIGWDDTVGDVLGPVIAEIDPALVDLTYVNLLTHRAGLRANLSVWHTRQLVGMLDDRDMMTDRLTYADAVLSQPPAGERDAFLYSNAGFVIAGAMMQQATGETWETLITRYVFAPLAMNTAGFGPPGTANAVDQPRGHRRLFRMRAVQPSPAADNIPALGPAGTVHLSAADMVTYLRAHASQDAGFLTTESWMLLHEPPDGMDYAMGWGVSQQGWLVHNGSNTLWYASAGFVPGTDRVVFMATNFAGRGKVAKAMAQGATAILAD